MQTIETTEDLKDWLISHKVPHAVAVSELAMKAWETALDDPSIGKIYAYWCMAGLNMHFPNIQIHWAAIYPSL